ncbi:MAG: gliding motility protein GldM [Bacteroidetes bacterium]|nr:gliding motility protein GldM [Bacteroidota bacterium]
MSIPKEPRQLMINIMYLVLTALLALNVSAEILNAFKTVEKGIKNSTEAVDAKNGLVYNSLVAAAKKDGREESLQLITNADQARKYREEFVEYIHEWKVKMIEASGGVKMEKGHEVLAGKKDVETTTNMFVEKGGGAEIEAKINEYRGKFLALLSEEDQAMLGDKLTLKAEKPEDPTMDWAASKFRKVPVQAVHTILTGLEADAYNCESTILDQLSKKVGAEDVKVDQFEAFAVSESKFLVTGKQYRADIFLGAKSSQVRPEVFIGNLTSAVTRTEDSKGRVTFSRIEKVPANQMPLTNAQPLEVTPDGRASFETVASGSRKVQGVIKVEKPGSKGELFDFYPFEFEYETFNPGGVVISPTAMNVLYIGVENPIAITAGNANPSTVSVSGCGIKPGGSGGKYIASPTGAPRLESINVSGKSNEGDPVSGQMEFRISRIPDPYFYLGDKKAGGVSKEFVQGQAGIIARNPDFVFDLKYQVMSFDMIYAPRSGPVISTSGTGNRFSDEQKTVMSKLRGGDRLFFSNVKVKMPDGTTREVNTSFTII